MGGIEKFDDPRDVRAARLRQKLERELGEVILALLADERVAEALRPHAVTDTNTVVVPDNVLMTGASMEGARTKIATDERWTGRILGAVAFATRPPPWIRAAFALGGDATSPDFVVAVLAVESTVAQRRHIGLGLALRTDVMREIAVEETIDSRDRRRRAPAHELLVCRSVGKADSSWSTRASWPRPALAWLSRSEIREGGCGRARS
jgi:hypothetical protein